MMLGRKLLTLIDIQNMSISEIYEKYSQGYILEGIKRTGCTKCGQNSKEIISKVPIFSLAPVCTKTTGVVGDIVHLKSTPTSGTAPYTVKFYRDTTLLTTFTGVPSGTLKTYDYTLVSADIGSRLFKGRVDDSCSTGSKFCEETCTIAVTAACAIPVCNFVTE